MVASGSLVSFHSIRVAGTTQSTQINAHECERHRMFDLSPAEASAGKPPRRLALPGAIARQNFLPRPSSFLRTVARIAYIYTQCFIIHHCAYFTQTVREGWLEILTWIVHDSSGVVRIIQHFMLSSPAMQSLSRKLSVLLQVTFSNFQVNAWKSISMFVMAFCAVQRCAAGKLDSKKQVA